MYNKLFTKILDSSIWLAPDTDRLVWITLLAAMDEDGFAQFASVANLAHRARVSPTEAEKAVEKFEGPDKDSSDPEHEGRRIERVPGGWMVLNAIKYRNLVSRETAKERTRERVARHRAKKAGNGGVTECNVPVTPSEAEAYTEAEAGKSTSAGAKRTLPTVAPEFDDLKAIYPKRAGSQPWQAAIKAANARLAEGETWDRILDGTRRYAAFVRATGKERTEFVLQAATFLGPSKRFLEPWDLPATKAEVRFNANAETARTWAAKVQA